MDSLYELSMYCKTNRIVIQCPTLCRHIHFFSAPDTVIILMRRKVEDIIASQRRIQWVYEWLELARMIAMKE